MSLIGIAVAKFFVVGRVGIYQEGRNEVYFFTADPVILPKFLIPGSKRDENFDPLSRKILLIQNA